MIQLIKYLWQLPQNLLGLLVVLCAKAKLRGSLYIAKALFNSGVSLGKYIIFQKDCYTAQTIQHEKGHQKQSLYLGWLYLPLIGLPSLLGNLVHRVIKFNYYNQPWEKWADKLGGVIRQ